jgi:dipeptidyl aminopeptidase/acylaminoacyl peptidase
MRRAALCFCVLNVSARLALASGPQDRQPTDPQQVSSAEHSGAKPADIGPLLATVRLAGASWSPSGKQIAYIGTKSGRLNVWVMNADGSDAKQLVKSDDRETGVVWSPDKKDIVFQQDRGGDELYDLYSVAIDGGTPVNLTKTDTVSETNPRFSPDGKWLAFGHKMKTAPSTDLAVMDWLTRKTRVLTHENDPKQSWTVDAWSPDNRYLYAVRGDLHENSSVYRVELTNGGTVELTPHEGKELITIGGISPDGKTLLLSSTEKGGYRNVALLDVESRNRRWITDTQWEAAPGDFSPDGSKFTYVLNADGRTTIHVVKAAVLAEDTELKTGEGINTPVGTPSSFASDGSMLFLHQDSTHAADLYVAKSGSAPERITNVEDESIRDLPLPISQLVHYPTFDGKLISAFVWMPFNLKRDGTNPAVVLPHGGPTGQTLDSFSPRIISLVSRGYIVIAPNVRGSTGYGVEFEKANYQDLGGGDLQDCLYGVKFLQATGYVDSKKVGITGGSYGGFMTLMAIGKAPEVWAAAVEEYGIIDWYTMLQHEDPYLQEYEKSLLGDPVKDRAKYEAASPIKYIHNEKAPLLVLQGERDIRVPKEEAAQVVDILKSEGRTVDVVYYPQEGHGFVKQENQVDEITRIVGWFDKYLKRTVPAT